MSSERELTEYQNNQITKMQIDLDKSDLTLGNLSNILHELLKFDPLQKIGGKDFTNPNDRARLNKTVLIIFHKIRNLQKEDMLSWDDNFLLRDSIYLCFSYSCDCGFIEGLDEFYTHYRNEFEKFANFVFCRTRIDTIEWIIAHTGDKLTNVMIEEWLRHSIHDINTFKYIYNLLLNTHRCISDDGLDNCIQKLDEYTSPEIINYFLHEFDSQLRSNEQFVRPLVTFIHGCVNYAIEYENITKDLIDMQLLKNIAYVLELLRHRNISHVTFIKLFSKLHNIFRDIVIDNTLIIDHAPGTEDFAINERILLFQQIKELLD